MAKKTKAKTTTSSKKTKKQNELIGTYKSAINSKPMTTVRETIPFVRVFEDEPDEYSLIKGIIMPADGVYTKSYLIGDANYLDIGDESQFNVLESFKKYLNSLSPRIGYEITVNNRTIDEQKFSKNVLEPYRQDNYDTVRRDINSLIVDNMQRGKNNIRSEKYLTLTVNASSIDEACKIFAEEENNANRVFKTMNNTGISVLTLENRLEILHDIYRDKVGEFKTMYNLETIKNQGGSVKDVICPSSFDFSNGSYFTMGSRYARTFYLKAIPEQISSAILSELSNISANSVISVHYEMIDRGKAVNFAKNINTSIHGDIQKQLKKLPVPDQQLLSPTLNQNAEDAKELVTQLNKGVENLFHITLVATIFADTLEDLENATAQIKTRAQYLSLTLDTLTFMQEQGFDTSLPLGVKYVHTHKVLPTYSTSAIQPFSSQELQIKGGNYYGINRLSKNIIVYNRNVTQNQNGAILGSSGSGKSFATKFEIMQTALNTTNSQVFIVDPDGEYSGLCKMLGGEEIVISTASEKHINPFDLDITINPDDPTFDPKSAKIQSIIAMIEAMAGDGHKLSTQVSSLVDTVLSDLYAPYLKYLKETGKTIDVTKVPTLVDLYEALKSRPEPEANALAGALRMFAIGSQNIFAHRTNIDISKKLITYNTKPLSEGSTLKNVAIQMALSDIWNKMTYNRTKGIRTWFYIDEAYLLLRNESQADYLEMIYKRARKWMGSPTIITQNVSDLLDSKQGNNMLKNSDFAILLKQSAEDSMALKVLYNLSDEQLEYINPTTNAGEGLIWTARAVIPFMNPVEENRLIFKICSTSPEDKESIDKLKESIY